MKRPNLEKLRLIAEHGINLQIPYLQNLQMSQARDMQETIDYVLSLVDYALSLEGALDLIRRGYPNPQSIAKDALGTQDASSPKTEPGTPEATEK